MEGPDPQTLTKVPMFASLSGAQRDKLASWLRVEEYGPGRMMTRTGTSGYAFYVLMEGRAHVELDGRVLEVLEPGSVFGEMAFFNPKGQRTADVVADGPTTVLSMFGIHFREMQMEIPEVAQQLERLFEQRSAQQAPTPSS